MGKAEAGKAASAAGGRNEARPLLEGRLGRQHGDGHDQHQDAGDRDHQTKKENIGLAQDL
jgi:hypothetical protein